MLHPFLFNSMRESSQALAMQPACTVRAGIPFIFAPLELAIFGGSLFSPKTQKEIIILKQQCLPTPILTF